ncbi:MAG: glycerophosphodiester phosphodiesterase [Candidatus Hydrogenedentes bacterium]|nr:glycerophosphodiester phosphodiesterase [Candidatus Hydrogenedentota bacterium]
MKSNIAVLILSLAIAAVGIPDSAEGQSSHSGDSIKPFFKRPFLLGAHRGGELLWPENTAAGFELAAKTFPGILLETDARMTADGAIVLMHDDSVDRTTNGKGKIADLTLAQIKALDAGYSFTKDGGATYPYRGKGVTVATLEEALACAPDSNFLVDFKGSAALADACIKIIRDAKAQDRVLIASFVPEAVARTRETAPELATCYDFASGAALLSALRGGTWDSYKPISDVLSMDEDMLPQFQLKPEDIKAIRAKGIKFQIHTINDPVKMRAYLDMGVDSILSDKPDLLAKAIEEWKKESDKG